MTICQANSNFCGCCGCSFKIEWQEAAGSCFAFPYGSGYSLPNFFGTCTTMQILHLNISISIILTEICPRKGGLGPPETKWPWAVILRKTYNLKLDLKDVVDFFPPSYLQGNWACWPQNAPFAMRTAPAPPGCLFVCLTLLKQSLFIQILSSPLSSINSGKKKFIFLELLGEKYHSIPYMGLLSRDNRDNRDCLGKAEFQQMVGCREI